jgi:type IV pilus assembly protein PilW
MKPLLPTPGVHSGAHRQRGFTLVEMMVAVTIGLVVILGVTVTFANLKATWNSQDKMAQLQDNERLAMAFLTSSVQEAGYYPDPTSPTPLPAFPDATYGNAVAGQIIVGTPAVAGTSSATLSTLYATANGDGTLTCQGATNTTGGLVNVRNNFYVDTAKKTLNCSVVANPSSATTMAAGDTALVSNVASMDVLYGVDTDGTGTAYQYVAAGAMTADYWKHVKSVRITLNFVSPNAALDTAHPVQWVQTINLMNNQ